MMKIFSHPFLFLSAICLQSTLATPDLATLYSRDLTNSYRQENEARTAISLNSVWRISLSETITTSPPKDDDFGFVLVPSSWMNTTEFPITGTVHFEHGNWSGTDQWKGKKTSEYPSAWYIREFNTPGQIGSRRVFLKLDRVTISGTVLLNGHTVGTLTEREDVRWDVTNRLAPAGKPNRLEVRVDALLSKKVKAYLGGDDTVIKEAKAHLRGITGDTWLIIEPQGPTLDNLFITTSTRKNTITFSAEVLQPQPGPAPVTFAVDVVDHASGQVVKQFSQTVPPPAPGDSIRMTHAWADAIHWDTDQPHLYTATAKLLSGNTLLDQTFPETFGFREVWLDGRDIILNGKPLHLYSYHSHAHDTFVNASRKVAESEIEAMTQIGFNSIQLGSEGTFSDGRSAQYYHDVLNLTDHKGIPVVMPVFPVYAYGWDDVEQRERWTQHMQALIKRYRNHPSLLIYGMNFNYLGYGWDMNPHTWASGYQPPDTINNLGKKRAEATASVERLQRVDHSRLIYNHASGNFGDFITSNFYPCWPPLQEEEDALSGWAQTGDKPMIFVELSLPVYILDLMRARQGNYMDVRYSEMLEAEYLSETLGPQAYVLQSEDYLSLISEGATAEEKAGTDKYNVNQSYIWRYSLREHEPLTTGMHALRPPFFKSWRTYGLTGFSPNNRRYTEYYGRQYEPWHGPAVTYTYADYTAPGPKPLTHHIPTNLTITSVGNMTRQNLQPAIVYFGGDEEAGFSSKDHAWFSGDSIHKQLVVVNDTRQDLDLTIPWRLENRSTGKVIRRGQSPVNVSSGTRGFAPLNFSAPTVTERTEYRLVADWPDDPTREQAHTFPFSLEVFPPAPSALQTGSASVGLYDPTGQTRAVFDALGIRYTAIDPAQPIPEVDVYVIGRDVLSATTRVPQSLLSRVIDQGKTLLCFEQRTLQDFGLRMHPRGQRTVFPLVEHHPILSGIEVEDLRHWRGAHSLTPAYPADRKETPGLYPEEFWKWGNKGVVASYMIEKPASGPLLSVAECGFDLNYTPLAELREGRGTVLLCQLEVTERVGTDPVATEIFNNLIEYGARLKPRTLQAVTLSGGLSEDALLQSTVADLPNTPTGIILHSGPVSEQQRQHFLSTAQKGGTIFLVGQDALSDLSWLPGNPDTALKTYQRAVPASDSPRMSGVSFSDTFIKDRRRDALPVAASQVTPLTDPGIIAERPVMRGRFIFVALDPVPYSNTPITPERSTRIYGKMVRILSILTANLGGGLTPLSQNYLDGFSTARVNLPEEWKFSIDLKNNGVREKWQNEDYDDTHWQTLTVPGLWENQGITNANPRFADSKRPYDGFAWYRCTVTLPEDMSRSGDLFLSLGAIDDMDTTYINGVRIGMTGRETKNAYAVERRYAIPPAVLEGRTEHTIAIRVYDTLGGGGITGPDLYIDRGEANPYPYVATEPPFNPYKLKRW